MVTIQHDGSVRFRVYLPHAARVELLGTFTDWRARRVAMTREHPGWWEATLPPQAVPPGEHQFCYLADGAVMLADYAAHGVRLGREGGWTSRLCIQAETADTTAREPIAA